MFISVSAREFDEAKAFERIVEQKGNLSWNHIDNLWYYIPYRNSRQMTYDSDPMQAVFKAWRAEKPSSTMAQTLEC